MDGGSLLARQAVSMISDASLTAVAARDARLDPKLVAAAHTFEASLMQELLKPLNASGAFGADEDDDKADSGAGLVSPGDGSGGALMSFGSEALAGALAAKGGLGIARRILDHFEMAANASAPNENPSSAPREAGTAPRRTGRE